MPVSPRRANAAEFDARLNRLIGDPLRQELRDPEFLAFVDRQFNRAFPGPVRRDATGLQIDSAPEVDDLEAFRPTVMRGDLELSGPVGARQKNRLTDLIGVKKALAKTGHLDFDVSEEASDKAGPRFQAALGRFQREHGLKADAVVKRDGPTLKALRQAVFEEGDGEGQGRPRRPGDNDNAARPQVAQSNATPEPDVVWPQSAITNEFRLEISRHESSHNYSPPDQKGSARGRYQLQPLILQDIGAKDAAGLWTGKYGIKSDQDFLNDPRVQERVFMDAVNVYRRQLGALRLEKGNRQSEVPLDLIGQEIDGLEGRFKLTEGGLIAAAHRAGAPTVRDYLKRQRDSGWKSDLSKWPSDPREKKMYQALETRLRKFETLPVYKP